MEEYQLNGMRAGNTKPSGWDIAKQCRADDREPLLTERANTGIRFVNEADLVRCKEEDIANVRKNREGHGRTAGSVIIQRVILQDAYY